MPKKKESTAQRALRKLRRKGRGSAADKLAVVAVDDLLATPMADLIPPDEVTSRTVAVLAGLAAAANLDDLVRERIEFAEERLAGEEGKVGDGLSDDARAALETLLAAPYTLDPEHTLKALDHEAMRGLVRRVLRETLTSFARRMRPSVPESRVLKGIGRRARKLASRPRERLGGLGDGVVGMVGGEVERQMERKVGEFVDGAVGSVLRRIAEYLAEPDNLESFGRMRVAGVRILLDTPVADGAVILDKLDRDQLVDVIAGFLRSLPDSPYTERWIRQAVEDETSVAETLGEYLERGDLLEPWRDWATAEIARRVRALAKGDAFGEWFEDLIGG